VSDGSKIQKVDLSATFACIGALSFWALGPIFIKYLTGYLDSWTQNLLRYSVACLLWMPFLIFSIKKGRVNARVWRRAVVPGMANVAFMVLLAKSSLIWIAGFSLIFFAEERALVKSKRFWSGLVLSATGVIGVMCFKEDFAAAGTLTGIVLTLSRDFNRYSSYSCYGVYVGCVYCFCANRL